MLSFEAAVAASERPRQVDPDIFARAAVYAPHVIRSANLRAHWIDGLLLIESATAFLWGWIAYPIQQGHTGDFLVALSHRPGSRWDGEGIGYGPLFTLLDLGLRWLSDLTVSRIMFLANHALLAGSLWCLLRLLLPPPNRLRALSLAVFAWVNFYPTFQLIRQNNIEITEVALLALMMFFLARRREGAAGVTLGLAIATKLIPVVLVPYLVWRRKWRAGIAALLTSATALAVVGALQGLGPIDAAISWTRDLKGASLQFAGNQSLAGLIHRALSTFDRSSAEALLMPAVDAPRTALLLSRLTSLGLIGLIVVLFVRRAGLIPAAAPPSLERLELGIVLLATFLAAPFSHIHYYGLVAFVYILAIGLDIGRGLAVAFGLSYVLFSLPGVLRLLDRFAPLFGPIRFVEWAMLLSVPTLGAAVLLGALLALHRGLSRSLRLAP